MDINSVVRVDITRETKVPTQKGFGIPAILSSEAGALGSFTDLTTTFSSDTVLEELIALGVGTGTQLYKAVVAIISQNPKPEFIKVIKQGALAAQVLKVNVAQVANAVAYTITLDGVDHTFTSDGSATGAEILAGLAAIVDALPAFTAVVAGADLNITAAVPGTGFSYEGTANLTFILTSPNHGPVEDLIMAREIDDDWYYLVSTNSTKVHILAIAAYIETEIKVYAAQTDDADSIDLPIGSDTTSVLGTIKAKGYDRTIPVYVPTAKLGEYKHAGWVSRQAVREPGTTNWKFKTVKSASADKYTAQELKNITDKKGNVYVTIGGIDMFIEGTVGSGEFIDIIVGTDWIQARMKEAVFGMLAIEEKVPYDDGGIEAVGLQVEKILDQAVQRTILVSDSNLDIDGKPLGPKVFVPTRAQTSVNDRATRTLTGVTFTGNYAGAINKVRIAGTISV